MEGQAGRWDERLILKEAPLCLIFSVCRQLHAAELEVLFSSSTDKGSMVLEYFCER